MSYHIGDAVFSARGRVPVRDEAPRLLERVTPRGTIELARSIAAARRMRAELFDADLFAEPAWDLLLDLYVATCAEEETPASSASLAIGVPASVGLRWIQELETRGLVARRVTDDRHPDMLRLSLRGLETMDRLLHAMLERERRLVPDERTSAPRAA